MSLPAVLHRDYRGTVMSFSSAGWFNATKAAARYHREPFDWLRQRETVEYLMAMARHLGISGSLPELKEDKGLAAASRLSRAHLLSLAKRSGLVTTKRGPTSIGGGTWMHPKLAVPFSRWLDVELAVWCDSQIERILQRNFNERAGEVASVTTAYWERRTEVETRDARSRALASNGAKLMSARRWEKPLIEAQRTQLEHEMQPQLFQLETEPQPP